MEHGSPFKWVKPNSLKLPIINSKEPDELFYDEPFEKYLADTTCISNSGLKKVLKSPRHYLAEAAGYFENDEDDEKEHFRFGRAAHMMILEPKKFKELYIMEPEFIGLTKDGRESKTSQAAKDQKKKWYEDLDPEALVVTQSEMDDLTYMIESLMDHPQAVNLLKNGRPEVTGRFTHKETGVRVRIRPDYLTFDGESKIFVSDIKTTRDASIGLFSDQTAKLKYHMQLALYADGISQITGKQIEAAAFIALEKKIPYSCAVYWLNEDDLAKGRQWYEYALMTYKRAVVSNEWPGVQGNGQMLNLPKWTDYETFPQFDWRDTP